MLYYRELSPSELDALKTSVVDDVGRVVARVSELAAQLADPLGFDRSRQMPLPADQVLRGSEARQAVKTLMREFPDVAAIFSNAQALGVAVEFRLPMRELVAAGAIVRAWHDGDTRPFAGGYVSHWPNPSTVFVYIDSSAV